MILDEIVGHKRVEIAPLRVRYADWSPPAVAPARRGFGRAVHSSTSLGAGEPRAQIALIAEFKRRSPSRGGIRPGALPMEVAGVYQQAGATALSVLTDERFFGGNLDDLSAARGAVSLPVLRKDFILEECQLAQSAGPDGPDAVLLIAAALTVEELRSLRELAARCGQDSLVEVHNEMELDRALESGATTIGINNRDLRTFQVSLDTTLRLRHRVPAGVPVVSESGIHTRDDVLRLVDAGVDAMLVGEALMAAEDPQAKVRELLGR